MKEKEVIRVALPKRLAEKIDELIKENHFTSRAEAVRYGLGLAILFEYRRLHQRAEDYAYQHIVEGIKRGGSVSRY